MASMVLSSLISMPLYGRYLEKGTWGLVMAGATLISYLPYLDGGFRTTINRQILAESEPAKRLEVIHFCQTLYSILSLLFLAGGLLLMLGYSFNPNVLHSNLPRGFFLAMGFAGALSVISSSQANLLVGLQEQTTMFILMGAGSWINLASVWLSLRAGAGIWTFPISTLIGVATTLPVACWSIRKIVPGIKFFSLQLDAAFWSHFHALKKEALHCFRSQIAILLLYTFDTVLVSWFCGALEVASYILLWKMLGYIRQVLQSSGEVAWPLLAQQGAGGQAWSLRLLRLNGWIYGSVLGAVCLTLPQFIPWYMGKAWTVPSSLLGLFAARYLITGLATPATYFLYGLGDFQALARYMEGELIAAVVLSLALVKPFGIYGVAAGFLLATLFGTFARVFQAYARIMKISFPRTLSQIWWRAGTGLAVSFLVAWLLRASLPRASLSPLVGMTAAGAGLAGALVVSWLRLRLHRPRELAPIRLIDVMNGL